MADVSLLEMTRYAGNAKPQAPGHASRHQVSARDLRDAYSSNARLLEFLAGLPVEQWFDPSAAAIKSGEIVPTELDETTALALLRDNPLLIRRPFVQVSDERRGGFDAPAIEGRIGPGDAPADLDASQQRPAEAVLYYVQSGNGSAFPCHFDPSSSR